MGPSPDYTHDPENLKGRRPAAFHPGDFSLCVTTMPFEYLRTIHFGDTDAAGVVFFPNYLTICHEAYEESLATAGIDLKTFFDAHEVVVPVSRSEVEYLRPLACGEQVRVTLKATARDAAGYAITFHLHRLGRPEKLAARVRTEHVCISSRNRERVALPEPLAQWLKTQSS